MIIENVDVGVIVVGGGGVVVVVLLLLRMTGKEQLRKRLERFAVDKGALSFLNGGFVVDFEVNEESA